MNYIVFDLELNNGIKKSKYKSIDCPNEVLQIGAVKIIDNKLDEKNVFSRLIKPEIYKNLNPRIRRLTDIEEFHLQFGISFKEALLDFYEWYNNDFTLVVWTEDDVREMKKNADFFFPEFNKEWLDSYINIQKTYIDLHNIDKGTQPSLKKAMLKYGINIYKTKHNAVDDSLNAAKVFLNMINKSNISLDNLI